MQRGKRLRSLTGILFLLFVLAAGILTGGVVQSRVGYAKTESYKVESVAGKKKHKHETKTSKAECQAKEKADTCEVKEGGCYSSKKEVSAYIHKYGCLPSNYLTKKEAQELGWDNKLGNLDEVAPGKCIGGDRFGNYEELLPAKKGRKYFECDIDYDGGYRGAKRIIYSDDGLIYYTEDHYKTFEALYDENGEVGN